LLEKVILAIKGMGMGFADVIPGVSGGTIALIVGIYTQFIEALKSVNFRWIPGFFAWATSGFSAEKRSRFLDPVFAIHWGFLVPLGVGIVTAFAIGSVIVPHLMDGYPSETAAFFVGLILASTIVPYRQMTVRSGKHLAIAVLAAVLTFFAVGSKTQPNVEWVAVSSETSLSLEDFMREHPTIWTAEATWCSADANGNGALLEAVASDSNQPGTADELNSLCARLDELSGDIAGQASLRDAENLGRKHDDNPFNTLVVPAGTSVRIARPALWYIFLSGVIGICAMVLPGISGSFFLLVLGVYHFMLSSALKGSIYSLIDGRVPMESGVFVVVFSAGCLVGLLSFARVMSRLFSSYPSGTLAALLGMMLGSLRALWPWKVGEPHTGVQNIVPTGEMLAMPLVAMGLGFAIVTALSIYDARSKKRSNG
jgi:uncharacterized membrane protein